MRTAAIFVSRPGAVPGCIALPADRIRMGDPAKSDARAEGGHEQERDADDDAGV